MEYRVLGKTGVVVSRLGFGGAPAGLSNYLEGYDAAAKSSHDQVLLALEKALALGVTYFDTAPGYGGGISESLMGEALAHREDIFVASKIEVSGETAMRQSLEQSLRRLGRSRLDLIQLHGESYSPADVDQILAPHGALAVLERFRQEGLVRFVGFSSEDNNPGLYRLIESQRVDVVQLCYNFLFQHPFEPSRPFGSLLAAQSENLGIVSMRAGTSGTFQRWVQSVNPDNAFDYTPHLIQFVLSNPLIDVALVGMRTADIVSQNAALVDNANGRVNLEGLHRRYV